MIHVLNGNPSKIPNLEDKLDLDAIRAAKDEPSKPWAEVKKALGL